jgi:plasmid stabilization system protein ParE
VTLDLVITPQAQADIDEYAALLDDRNPEAGTRFLHELSHVLDRLVTFPAFGQASPTPNHPELRRAVLPNFPLSVFYQPTATTIIVARVIHHARDLPPLLDEL